MNKVFISRPDGSVSWGFRLQGGLEYNEPLTITNIVPNSPADGKISPGDMLIEIAGNNVRQMIHKDALELIQRCGNALFLTIQKAGYSNATETCGFADQEQQQQQQQQSSYTYDSSSPSSYNNTSATSIGNTSQAPIFDPNFTTKKTNSFMNRQSSTETYPTYEQSGEMSPILAKFLNRPGGPKPFTYTPGGLDLSKLLDAARTRRHPERRSTSENRKEFDPVMSRRMIVPSEQLNQHHYTAANPIQPFSYARQQPPPPQKKHIEHDTDVITQSRSFQMLQGWISDSEKTVPNTVSSSSPSTQYSTYRSADAQNSFDLKNNTDRRRSSSGGGTTSLPSRSFRYLQEQYSVDRDDNNNNNNNSPQIVQRTIEKTPANGTGLRRGSDAHNPSRAFRFLQDQYDVTQEVSPNRSRPVNNRNDLMEIYHKVPPSFREREPEAPRYSGATVPSRSFRFLQMMTQDSQEQDDLKPNNNYTKAQQSLLNKYDEQNFLTNKNRINDHPSRSFKYLQEMTGEQRPTETSTLANRLSSTDLGATDF
ncbi:unnamed protein product [Rotaria socialis]|uniref:PDZ domain-containing protein n=1 Tax=Rotaria socialis TaxID=392032 RepID=A0A818LPC4_9BILA|nr:unnamed protein product [Rotaria socialis]CAF4477028.1 unnamed protein product [Rotaria socialis]